MPVVDLGPVVSSLDPSQINQVYSDQELTCLQAIDRGE